MTRPFHVGVHVAISAIEAGALIVTGDQIGERLIWLSTVCPKKRPRLKAKTTGRAPARSQAERGEVEFCATIVLRDSAITTVSPPPVPLKLNALLVRSISPPDWAWTLNRRRRLSPSPASPRARGDE